MKLDSGVKVDEAFQLSPSTRRVWIEIMLASTGRTVFSSPSTRRVWIEIGLKQTAGLFDNVTLHAEGVD